MKYKFEELESDIIMMLRNEDFSKMDKEAEYEYDLLQYVIEKEERRKKRERKLADKKKKGGDV